MVELSYAKSNSVNNLFSIAMLLFCYYNLSSNNRAKEEPCIGFIQENSMEFQLQSVYATLT